MYVRHHVKWLWIVSLCFAATAQQDVVPEDGAADLPRVLLLGDSISLGYDPPVRNLLAEKASVHHPPENCQSTVYALGKIDEWVGDEPWDVIHFNWGIWDAHHLEDDRLRATPEEYEQNLRTLVARLKATGAQLIWASITPMETVHQGAIWVAGSDIPIRNEIARKVMEENAIPINDLYAAMLPRVKQFQAADGCHFTPEGYAFLGQQVTEHVLKALENVGDVASRAETEALDWAPEETSRETRHGREVTRYEHDCLPRWAYAEPHREFFYVAGANGQHAERPLVVFLHSAGGNAEKEMDGNVERLAGYGDEFVGLLLNSPSQLAQPVDGAADYDWWWGAKAIEKDPERYRGNMTRVENRAFETIEWVIQNYAVDRDRVYLRGISMGGSGTLGLGLAHGDVFAALQADVFAGTSHALFRMEDAVAEPPYAVTLLSPLDGWSKGAEQLYGKIPTEYLGMSYAWDVHGHDHMALRASADQAVVNFPWLSIRRNQAYPVFTNASSDDTYPGHMSKEPDQRGQVNAYFRWSVLEDTETNFIIELRLVQRLRFMEDAPSPEEFARMRQPITADVTLRRLQHFPVLPDAQASYPWRTESEGSTTASGQIAPNDKGLLTVEDVEIGLAPVRLAIAPP